MPEAELGDTIRRWCRSAIR